MPAYVIVCVDITDPEGYQSYLPGAGAAVQAHGGQLLSADSETAVLEGSGRHMTVVLEFPDKAVPSAVVADGFVPAD